MLRHLVPLPPLLLAALATPPAAGQTAHHDYDLVIRGGTVYDGTAGPPRRADIAIRGSRIAAVGEIDADASVGATLDASGFAIAPGFIDVHTHADVVARNRPRARNLVRMGVTTIVTGNCGSSVLDLYDHFARIERRGIAINYASLIGHGTVRRAAMGTDNRAPTPAELDAMRAHVRRAMQSGAFGLSTGLIYVPGTYAKTDEIVELARVVAEFGGVYASHMRNEGSRVLDSIEEALDIGERAGVHVHLSHLKASGKPNWGRSAEIVEMLTAARADGRRVTGDQYAYAASSTGIDVLFPSAALAIGRKAFSERLRDDAAFRDEMAEALFRTMDRQGFGDLSYCQIANARGHAELQGMRISEAAERLFGSESRESQARAAIELFVAAGGARVGMVYHKMAEDDVERIMRLPFVAVACDAGIRSFNEAERPHPRGAGNNPRVLGRYVRERGTLSLELAIHKMTGLPARIFGIQNRGEIRDGAFADLVVFDPELVADGATYDAPVEPPLGMPHVLVNGEFVVHDGAHTGRLPGRVLRFSARPGQGRRP